MNFLKKANNFLKMPLIFFSQWAKIEQKRISAYVKFDILKFFP